jgi:hypothetical protein
MGTVLASTIISRARGILNDTDSTSYTWSNADLLSYLNAAQRNIVFLKPETYIENEVVQLAAGTKQDVTDGIGLIKLTRNMGTGSTPGAPIFLVPMEQFNYIVAGFHTATASATVEVYAYDKDDPAHYYVYPPQPSTPGYVEEIHIGLPSNLSETSDAIILADIYEDALLNYILYRAYSREVDQFSSQESQKYYGLYLNELGIKDTKESELDPINKG